MLASTDGARAAGAKVSVVYYRPELATNFKGEVASNIGDESFEEKNYIDRTQRLLQMSDASIVFKGGTGTISEFAMAWGIARLYIDHHKPLLLYGGFWYPIMESIATQMKVRADELHAYKIVTTVDEAIHTLEEYEVRLAAEPHEHATCVGPECSLML
jgi:predicted Rossmann-fold nucleotide-binding protein